MRDRYRYWHSISPRWRDNDIYGHVNNSVYFSYIDTVVNRYLIGEAGLDIHTGAVIGIAASASCEFHAPLAFPDEIDAGLAVTHLGNSSVHYEVGLFAAGAEEVAAVGTLVHVFVDRSSRRPVAVPDDVRAALSRLAV